MLFKGKIQSKKLHSRALVIAVFGASGVAVGSTLWLCFGPKQALVVDIPLKKRTRIVSPLATVSPQASLSQGIHSRPRQLSIERESCPKTTVRSPQYSGTKPSDYESIAADSGVDYQFSLQSWIGVSASESNAGTLAVWSEQAIYFSSNDGATFDQLLSGPGTVYGVAIDCHGGVFAARGSNAGIRIGYHRDGAESWRTLPLANTPAASSNKRDHFALHSVGGHLFVLASAEMSGEDSAQTWAISADHGETWRYLRPPSEVAELAIGMDLLGQRDDGSYEFAVYLADCEHYETSLAVYSPETGTLMHAGMLAFELIAPKKSGHHYYFTRGDTFFHLSQHQHTHEMQLTGYDRQLEETCHVFTGAKVLGHCSYGSIVQMRGDKGELLTRDQDAHFMTMDAQGRLVGTYDGRVVRWSPEQGLRVLYKPA